MSHRRHLTALQRWDSYFDQGNASSVTEDGGKIRITPYLYSNGNQWTLFSIRSDRLGGKTPHFLVAKASRFGGDPTAAENMAVWSAAPDVDTWYKFDNQSIGVADIEFYNNAPFPNGMIYISYLPLYPFSRVGRVFREWIKDARVTLKYAGQDTRRNCIDGRVAPAVPFYGLLVTNASGYTKNNMILVAGSHGNESEGPYQLEGAMSWLLGGSPEAEFLLDWFNVYVYPCVNPQGLVCGYSRSAPQHSNYSHDGYWDTTGTFDSVDAFKTAWAGETGSDIEIGIDFHGSVGDYTGYMGSRDHTELLYARLLALMQGYSATFTYNDAPGLAYMLTDIWRDSYSAALSVDLEGGAKTTAGITNWKNQGQYTLEALTTMQAEGRWTNGPGVGSRDFNGTTDRIDWNNVFNTVTASSVSLWFYADSIPSGTHYIFCSHNSTNTLFATLFGLGYSTASTSLIAWNSGGATAIARSSADIATASLTGAWHHLLYTWDGSTNYSGVHVFLDGSEVTYNFQQNGVTLTAATGKWSLGGRIYDDLRNFDGHIAQVGAWDRVLTSTEIANLAAGYAPDLVDGGSNLKFYFKGNTSSLVAVVGGTGTADGTTSVTGVGNGPSIIYG